MKALDHFDPTPRYLRYWAHGAGAEELKWGTAGDMDRCQARLGNHIKDPKVLAGLCSTLKKESSKKESGQ